MGPGRVAATLLGLALAFDTMFCPYLAPIAILLLACGLLPRRGVKVGRRAVKLAAGLVGCPLLALTLLVLAGMAASGAPLSVATFFLAVALIPSLALALYGLGLGVVPSLGARAVARVRVAAFSATAISAGSLLAALLIALALADPRFLSEVHVVHWGLARLPLPGWAIFIVGVAPGLFFLVLGAIALADFREVVGAIEGLPWSWIPRRSKAGQVFVLAFFALLVWVGPFISMRSLAEGVLASLAGVLVSSCGALVIVLIADHLTGKAVYERLRRRLRLLPAWRE